MYALRLGVVAGLLAVAALAQDSRGSIVGSVADRSGAALGDIDVRAVNRATGDFASRRMDRSVSRALTGKRVDALSD